MLWRIGIRSDVVDGSVLKEGLLWPIGARTCG